MASPQTASDCVSPSGVRLFTVRSFEVDEWWPDVEPIISRWLKFDETWTPEGVRNEIKAGRAQLWCVHKDAIVGLWVTRIVETDSMRVGLVWGCAGDLRPVKDEAIELFGITEDWFRESGCQFVDWIGREGWERIFPGYRRHAVVMRKRL